MVGFLHVFAHLQKKLSEDVNQLELLRQLLNLQKDMVVMLLSMLEGTLVAWQIIVFSLSQTTYLCLPPTYPKTNTIVVVEGKKEM